MAEALGVAAAVAQFATMGLKTIHFINSLYRSENGTPQEYEELTMVTEDIEKLTSRLRVADNESTSIAVFRRLTEDEVAIRQLATESEQIARQLLDFIDGILGKKSNEKARSGKRRLQSFKVGIELAWKEGDVKQFEGRLQRVLQEMSMRTMNLLRYNISPAHYAMLIASQTPTRPYNGLQRTDREDN